MECCAGANRLRVRADAVTFIIGKVRTSGANKRDDDDDDVDGDTADNDSQVIQTVVNKISEPFILSSPSIYANAPIKDLAQPPQKPHPVCAIHSHSRRTRLARASVAIGWCVR